MRKERFDPERGWIPIEEEAATLKRKVETGEPLSGEEQKRLEAFQAEQKANERKEKELKRVQKEWEEDRRRG